MNKLGKRLAALALSLALCLPLTVSAGAYNAGSAHVPVGNLSAYSVVDVNRDLWTWGQISVPGTDGRLATPAVPQKLLSDVAFTASSFNTRAAIRTDGSLWMWGINSAGQLGNNMVFSTSDNEKTIFFNPFLLVYNTPFKVMDHVTAVSCGSSHTAAIRTDGSLWVWGSNSLGQLGNETIFNYTDMSDAPTQTTPTKLMDHVTAVSCGDSHTAAIKTDGSLWLWGDNGSYQLGNGGTGDRTYTAGLKGFGTEHTAYYQTTPVKVMDHVVSVSCGDSHTAAIDQNGDLWVWGSATMGALGDPSAKNHSRTSDLGTTYYQTVPVKVMSDVAAVSCGANVTAVIKTDGSLWVSGYSKFGALGLNKNSVTSFTKVPGMDKVVSVSASELLSTVLKADGTVWVCGKNDCYELGLNDDVNRSVFVQQPTLKLNPAGAGKVVSSGRPAAPGTQVAYPALQRALSTSDFFSYLPLRTYALKDENGYLTNYVKLRDLAYYLNGTDVQFDVSWDGCVNLRSKTPYHAVGGELIPPFFEPCAYTQPTAPTKLDGAACQLDAIVLTDPNGGGHTYYKLRDLGRLLNFDVSWFDGTIWIDPYSPYSDAD